MLDQKLDTLLLLQKERNFTKTSMALGITQPAVTTHIKQLEAELGCKLFIRNKSNLVPTEKGEIVIGYAKRIKALYQKMLDELDSEERQLIKIKIGIVNTLESCDIVKVLGKYSSHNDAISLTVVTDSAENLSTQLQDYELDLIVLEDEIVKPDVSCAALGCESLYAVIPVNNPLSGKSEITLQDLKKEKLILRMLPNTSRKLFEAALSDNEERIEDYNVTIEVDNLNTIKDLVEHNIGISILTKANCYNLFNNKTVKLLPISGLQLSSSAHLVYLSEFTHKAIISDIVSIYNNLD